MTDPLTQAQDTPPQEPPPSEVWVARLPTGELTVTDRRPGPPKPDPLADPALAAPYVEPTRYVQAAKLESLTRLTEERAGVVQAAVTLMDVLHQRAAEGFGHPEVVRRVEELKRHVAHHAKREYR